MQLRQGIYYIILFLNNRRFYFLRIGMHENRRVEVIKQALLFLHLYRLQMNIDDVHTYDLLPNTHQL